MFALKSITKKPFFTGLSTLGSIRLQSTNALTKTSLPYTFSASGPSQIKYTKQHEWVCIHPGNVAFVGITKYAADALGDATYIELPEVGSSLEIGESFGSVESVKSASEIYSPLNGTVLEINEQLQESPQLINENAVGEGWLVKASLDDLESDLMELTQYEESLTHDDH